MSVLSRRREDLERQEKPKRIVIYFLVTMIVRNHLYPFRTQKLSSQMLKILARYLAGKISSCQIFLFIYSPIAQSVERSAVNR